MATQNASLNDITNIFWTGGWDSTFRLLQLLFDEKKAVQPHYIIRTQECSGLEINTINNISRKIYRNYSYKSHLLKPVIYKNSTRICKNNAITNEYYSIKKTKKINKQYEVCARYCNQLGINSMELCVINDEVFDYFMTNKILFKYFEFPVLGLSKQEMANIADKNGWGELMRMTWFCRRPKSKNSKPCGFCGPCTDAIIGGVGWRLPLISRTIANIQLPVRNWWRNNYQKQSKGILKHVSRILRHKT